MTQNIVGIIGRGRMATHMAHYLKLESIPIISWHRDTAGSPERVLGDCDPILLLIKDDAISSFVDMHPSLLNHQLVHFSGSKVIPGIPSLHPLMTFGPDLYDLDTYRTVPFIEVKDGLRFGKVFPSLLNPSYCIDQNLKPLYHALCVMAGNFTTLLWANAIDTFERTLGLPGAILFPYLKQACENASTLGIQALTGPLVRQDWETVRENIQALQGDPFENVYRVFAEIYGYIGGET
ncbi:MAG: DUF2520 domain-containing protein [Spirochaetales bacterium]|jgi:2-dehydropantoate 2-reductase|nr:DUF2520 domain-containing protein [Spirochaetales bacterium]